MDSNILLPELCDFLRPFLGLSQSRQPLSPSADLITFAQKRHRVGAILAKACLDLKLPISSETAQELASIKLLNEQAYLRKKAVERKLLKLFERHNLHVIVLKGAPLGDQLYANPSIRSAKDIDLLVNIADARRAIDILTSNGLKISAPPDKSPTSNVHVHHKGLNIF